MKKGENSNVPGPLPLAKPGDRLPALPFFLQFKKYKHSDWLDSYRTVMSVVFEKGCASDYAELDRFYGRKYVVHALKTKLIYLPDHVIPKVCDFFDLKWQELRCSERQPWRGLPFTYPDYVYEED